MNRAIGVARSQQEWRREDFPQSLLNVTSTPCQLLYIPDACCILNGKRGITADRALRLGRGPKAQVERPSLDE